MRMAHHNAKTTHSCRSGNGRFFCLLGFCPKPRNLLLKRRINPAATQFFKSLFGHHRPFFLFRVRYSGCPYSEPGLHLLWQFGVPAFGLQPFSFRNKLLFSRPATAKKFTRIFAGDISQSIIC